MFFPLRYAPYRSASKERRYGIENLQVFADGVLHTDGRYAFAPSQRRCAGDPPAFASSHLKRAERHVLHFPSVKTQNEFSPKLPLANLYNFCHHRIRRYASLIHASQLLDGILWFSFTSGDLLFLA